jgi:hypothetical protein
MNQNIKIRFLWQYETDHAVLSGETIVPRTIVLLTVKHHVKGTTAITLLLTIVVSKSYVKDFNVKLMGLQYSLWILAMCGSDVKLFSELEQEKILSL